MIAAGWIIEPCGPGTGSTPTEPPADANPDAVRALADRLVSQGRGRDPGLIWTNRLGDALAGADAAARLDIPLVYDATDIAATAAASDAAWASTDAGRLERTLYHIALGAADLLVTTTEAGAAWLMAQGVTQDRFRLARDTVSGGPLDALLRDPEISVKRRRAARTAA